jgi:hypothetical protein
MFEFVDIGQRWLDGGAPGGTPRVHHPRHPWGFSPRPQHSHYIECPKTLEEVSNVGLEILITVVMKSYVFRDITPCSLLKVNRRFGGICCFHLQGRSISQERNQCETSTCLFFDPEDGGNMSLRNVGRLPTDYTALYEYSIRYISEVLNV